MRYISTAFLLTFKVSFFCSRGFFSSLFLTAAVAVAILIAAAIAVAIVTAATADSQLILDPGNDTVTVGDGYIHSAGNGSQSSDDLQNLTKNLHNKCQPFFIVSTLSITKN